MHEFRKQHRRERRFLGWFQHAGAARQQGRDHLERDLVHRPVPGGDQSDNADRFQRDTIIRGVRTQRTDPLDMVKRCQKILQMPRKAGRLTVTRQIDRSPHFKADRLRHFLGARLVLRKDRLDIGAAGGRRRGSPRRESGLGSGNSRVGIGIGAKRDDGARILRRGINHRIVTRGERGGPTAINIEIALDQHVYLQCLPERGRSSCTPQAVNL